MHAIRRISGGSIVVFVGTGLWACAASPPAVDDVFGDGCPDGCPEATTGADDGADDAGADEGDTGDEPSASSDADRPDDDPKPPSGGEEGGDSDIPDGDNSDGGSSTCCEAENATCLAGSDSASVCSALDTICTSGACEGLVTVCDPTTVPVSTACARAYYACFNFRVNKCQRTDYNQCMSALGDDALCTTWDQSCADREAYCAEILGLEACGTEGKNGGACGPKGGELGAYYYDCTDWGHRFDPCWDEYVACTDDAAACDDALSMCAHAGQGDIYDTCGYGDDGRPNPGDGDHGDDGTGEPRPDPGGDRPPEP